ncbi:MAG: hypothetical protein COA96_14505 [SAR86 cluster bacterium]|uniref:DUF488 domain-containing protein n=1 Tax=SAR86 cluster bacterium TaxID=2030880 RepID=A0A2A5AT71_9GAMM|nr:MAG: hypothetical protein COA96_14505 [SAR86 cluster bacterium]
MLYSIGYATKPFDVFIEHLQQHKINVVADVRSVPFSTVFHDYHQPALEKALPEAGIRYVYLGTELGPRSKDSAHYDKQGQVQFSRLVESDLFKQGVERLQTGMEKGFSIALMCAEKNPANCHRSLLIAHYMKQNLGVAVQHIGYDGNLEAQEKLEQRLVDIQNMSEDLLTKPEELESLAYQQHLKQTSYKRRD